MASNVSTVYVHVIDDVLAKVRDDFISYGVGDAVLNELQAIWEMKMVECGALSGTIERGSAAKGVASAAGGSIPPVHDLNVPYEGAVEEYATPTAEMLFPPTPMQTPAPQTPLPGTADPSPYSIPTGNSDYGAPSPLPDFRNGVEHRPGRPSLYMHPPSPWMAQRPLGVDVNVAYVEGREDGDRGAASQSMTKDFMIMAPGKRKRDDLSSQMNSGSFLPQQDGSADFTIDISFSKADQVPSFLRHREATTSRKLTTNKTISTPLLPQRDGIQDDYNNYFNYQGINNEDYNAPEEPAEYRTPAPVSTPNTSKNDAGDDDEPPLNEDDDDEDELNDLEQGDEEPVTQHLVLAQFDKVTRTKNRWKCTLKDGIMHLNGRDLLFNKANGEFNF